jgi:hypothetical protein
MLAAGRFLNQFLTLPCKDRENILYIYIYSFNLIKVKEIFKPLDVFFSRDIDILSIKPRNIIVIIGGEVMENKRQNHRFVSVWEFHRYRR